jgi:hypothetical protein
MQLVKLSCVACAVLLAANVNAQDYVSLQYMGYDEESGRTNISVPSIEINKDFGADYTVNISIIQDAISGASPTFYDASSGASTKLSTSVLSKQDIAYGDIDYEEKRDAYGALLTKRFENRDELTLGLNHSKEYDYESNEISSEYLHHLDSSKNQSVSLGISYQKNDVLKYDTTSGASGSITKNLEVLSAELGFTQVLDKTSLAKISVFNISENGYLSNPYLRVVRNYDTNPIIAEDKKPESRKAYGVFLQYSKALNEQIASNSSYRYYSDDWGIASQTFTTEVNYEWTGALTAGVAFRAYTQTEADFYHLSREYFTNEEFASSDKRMSDFDTQNIETKIKYDVNAALSLNGAIGYYTQFDYFSSTYYNIGLKYKF